MKKHDGTAELLNGVTFFAWYPEFYALAIYEPFICEGCRKKIHRLHKRWSTGLASRQPRHYHLKCFELVKIMDVLAS